jgi:hypothetical protein
MGLRAANRRLAGAPLGLAVSKNRPLKPERVWHFASAMRFGRRRCFIRVGDAGVSNVPRFGVGASECRLSSTSALLYGYECGPMVREDPPTGLGTGSCSLMRTIAALGLCQWRWLHTWAR